MESPGLSPIASDLKRSPGHVYSSSSSTMLSTMHGGSFSTPLSATAMRRLAQRSLMLPGIEEETSAASAEASYGASRHRAVSLESAVSRTTSFSSPSAALAEPLPAPRPVSVATPLSSQKSSPFGALADDLGMRTLSLRDNHKERERDRTDRERENDSLHSISLLEDFAGAEDESLLGATPRRARRVVEHAQPSSSSGGAASAAFRESMESRYGERDRESARDRPSAAAPLPLPRSRSSSSHGSRDSQGSAERDAAERREREEYGEGEGEGEKKRRGSRDEVDDAQVAAQNREQLGLFYDSLKRRENAQLIADARQRWSKYATAPTTTTPAPFSVAPALLTPQKRESAKSDTQTARESPLAAVGDTAAQHKQQQSHYATTTLLPPPSSSSDPFERISVDDLKQIRIALYPTTSERTRSSQKHVRIVSSLEGDEEREERDGKRERHTQQRGAEDEMPRERERSSHAASVSSATAEAALPVGSVYALILDSHRNPLLIPVAATAPLGRERDSHAHSHSASRRSARVWDDEDGSDEELSAIYSTTAERGRGGGGEREGEGERDAGAAGRRHRKKRLSPSLYAATAFDPVRRPEESVLGEISFLSDSHAYPHAHTQSHHHTLRPQGVPASDAKRVKFETSSFFEEESSLQSIQFISRPARRAVPVVSPQAVTTAYGGMRRGGGASVEETTRRAPPAATPYHPWAATVATDAFSPPLLSPFGQSHGAVPYRRLNADLLSLKDDMQFTPFGRPTGELTVSSSATDSVFSSGIIGSGAVGKSAGSNSRAWRSKLIKRDMTSVLHSPQIRNY